LQSLAWVGMVVNYSHGSSIKEALIKTFDGKHPCKLCRFVATGKKSDSQREAQKPAKKFDLFCQQASLAIKAPELVRLETRFAGTTCWPDDTPPKPPPRQVPG